MNENLIQLDKNKNPEYFSLINEYNEIIDSLNPIKRKIFDFRIPEIHFLNVSIPRVTLFNKLKYTKELSKIGSEVKVLQNQYIQWNKKAWHFCDSPRYILSTGNDVTNAFAVTHYNSFLLSLINQLNADITLLVSDYNLRYTEIENSANYWTAITAWVITSIALLVSLYGLFTAISYPCC